MNTMHLQNRVDNLLDEVSRHCLPHIHIYNVIWSYHNHELKLFLLQFNKTSYYSLPGGYVYNHESLDDAARRNLQQRSGLQNIPLQQFYTDGNYDPHEKDLFTETLKMKGIRLPAENHFNERKIAVCYYSVLDETQVNPVNQDEFINDFKWVNIKQLPRLMYKQHAVIIEKALMQLQNDLDKNRIACDLMQDVFTMSELQILYETIHQKSFIRSNFQRRMLNLDVLERLEKQFDGKAHKAPYLYRFKKKPDFD